MSARTKKKGRNMMALEMAYADVRYAPRDVSRMKICGESGP